MSSPCNTCAFRAGCITHDKEPHNALKGEICALSGVPFFCHYDKNGVDHHGDVVFWMRGRGFDINGENAQLRICEGWKKRVLENQARGFFKTRYLRFLRKMLGNHALRLIDVFLSSEDGTPEKLEAHAQLKTTIEMIAQADDVEYKPEMGELEISQKTV
jgi:hypothetical protein